MFGELSKDNWHREVATVAERNLIEPRRWGMRVTVYNDGVNSGDYVLSFGLSSTNKQDNSNWLLVAAIGATWGGGTSVTFGTVREIPFVNATEDDFSYSSGVFEWNDTFRRLAGGSGLTMANPSNGYSIVIGQTITFSGDLSWTAVFGDEHSITVAFNDNILSGNLFSASGGPVANSIFAGGSCSVQSAALKNGCFISGLVNTINSSSTASGVALVGGTSNTVQSGSSNTVIIGGTGITARNNEPNQVYVPNLNINSTPSAGTIGTHTVLTRNPSTGQITTIAQNAQIAGSAVSSEIATPTVTQDLQVIGWDNTAMEWAFFQYGPAGNTNEFQKNGGGGVFAGTGVYSETDGNVTLGQPGGGTSGDDRLIASLASDGENAGLLVTATFLRFQVANISLFTNTDLTAFTGNFVYYPLATGPAADPPSAEGYFQYSSGSGIPSFRNFDGTIITLEQQAALTAPDSTDLSTELAAFPDTLAVINNIRTRQGEIETALQAIGLLA